MGYDLCTAHGDGRYHLNVSGMGLVRQALAIAGVVNEAWIRFRLDVPPDAVSLELPVGDGVPMFKLCLNEGALLSERECRLLAHGLRGLVGITREAISATEEEERWYLQSPRRGPLAARPALRRSACRGNRLFRRWHRAQRASSR